MLVKLKSGSVSSGVDDILTGSLLSSFFTEAQFVDLLSLKQTTGPKPNKKIKTVIKSNQLSAKLKHFY